MKIFIISICNKKDILVDKFIDKYRKQINSTFSLSLIDIGFSSKKNANQRNHEAEGEQALSLVKKDSLKIALDQNGEKLSSEKLAKNLDIWQQNYSNIYFFIGGPDGLSQNIKAKADYIISLSDLTFPHQFVKIILSEQLYRSICIMRHHPYHR